MLTALNKESSDLSSIRNTNLYDTPPAMRPWGPPHSIAIAGDIPASCSQVITAVDMTGPAIGVDTWVAAECIPCWLPRWAFAVGICARLRPY